MSKTVNDVIGMMELAERVVGRMDHKEIHQSAVIACFDLYTTDSAKFEEDRKAEEVAS